MPKRKWNELSPRTRRLLVVAAVGEGVLKVLALLDLKRRPPETVRGSRAGWATTIVLANSAGLVPIAYFVLGRRKRGPQP